MFKKKTEDFVDLSFGRVYIKELTNVQYNFALAKSTAVQSLINNHLFLEICERFMTQLYFWEWRKLTIRDGNKLREKIISMLKHDEIVSDIKEEQKEDKADLFANVSSSDKEWFQNAASRQAAIMGEQNGNWRNNNRKQ